MTTCIHPIFEKCIQYTLDEYWQDVFSSCADNKFPPGVRYNPTTNVLYVKRDAKKATPITLPDDPIDVFKRMMKVFRNECEMMSSRDIAIQKDDVEDMKRNCVVDLDCEWKKLKPRYIKEQLLFNYVTSLKTKYNLTPGEIKKLLATIQLAFQFKQISSDDIDYSQGVINDITDLEFDEKKRCFYVNRTQRGKTSNSTAKNDRTVKPTRFTHTCDKYLKDYQKRFKNETL